MKKILCGLTTILALAAVMAMAEEAVETKVESVKTDDTCVKATPAACDQAKTIGCGKSQTKAGCPMMAAKKGASCAAGVKTAGKTCGTTGTGCPKSAKTQEQPKEAPKAE